MIKNENKDKIQKEALVQALKPGNTLLTMATGSGKSKVAIDFCKKTSPEKVALLVPTENLRDETWKDEFLKWGFSEDFWENNVDKLCYASGSKRSGEHYNVIICDEAHCLTQLSSEFFQNNTYDKILALTATPPNNLEKIDIFKRLNFRNFYDLPIDKAIQLGVVSPYKIVVVYTQLNNTLRYLEAGSKTKPFKSTERNQYDFFTKKIDSLSSSEEVLDGVRVVKYLTPKDRSLLEYYQRKRMHLIYNLRSKEYIASKILQKLPETSRYLIFSGSIEQAEKLCPYSYHSKTSSEHLDRFKKEEINRLSCVEALNMGENLPNIDGSIMVQVKSSEITMIQKIGRNIRFREGHEATIYILVAKGTQDEVWFEKATKTLDKSNFEFKTEKDFL